MVGTGANQELVLPPEAELFEQVDAVMLQLEIPINTNPRAAIAAKEAGVRIILDPAPAVANLPPELLQLADVVSPNESELATLAGRPVGSVEEAIDAGRCLIGRGVRILVVKLGEKGALWMTPWSHELIGAVAVEAVDTTAAGDVFTGTLTVGLADGLKMRAAIKRACLAGALACTRIGAQPSIPTARELAEWSKR